MADGPLKRPPLYNEWRMFKQEWTCGGKRPTTGGLLVSSTLHHYYSLLLQARFRRRQFWTSLQHR